MLFGTSAFSESPFSTLPFSRVVYVGVSGFTINAELSRVVVTTPFNINAEAFPSGNQLTVNVGQLGSIWLPITTNTGSIWTPIIT